MYLGTYLPVLVPYLPVFRIRIRFNPDPDPGNFLNPDPGPGKNTKIL
jgi:hypothetical protein